MKSGELMKLAEHTQKMPVDSGMRGPGQHKQVNTILDLPLVSQMTSQACLSFLTLSAVESLRWGGDFHNLLSALGAV